MNRREFLMTTLAAFALSALPKLTFAETIPVSDAVKHKIDPKNKLGFGFMRLPLKNPEVWPDLFRPPTGQKLYMCKIFIRFLEKFHPLVPRKPYAGP